MPRSGAGRCGSTLVERVLNASPRFCAVGEFHCLWHEEKNICACGLAYDKDPYWVSILAKAGVTADDLLELDRLEALVSRTVYLARHHFDLAALSAQPEVRRFLALQFKIFEAVAQSSGKAVVVDSSKAGPRAWILACDPRSHFIHLRRDSTAVLASWRSKKFDPGLGTSMRRPGVLSAAGDWLKVERLMRSLAQQRPVGLIDYETFCRAPEAELGMALAKAGLPGAMGVDFAEGYTVLPNSSYHSINGNPDRFDPGPIRIARRDIDWSRHDPGERARIWLTGRAIAALSPHRTWCTEAGRAV